MSMPIPTHSHTPTHTPTPLHSAGERCNLSPSAIIPYGPVCLCVFIVLPNDPRSHFAQPKMSEICVPTTTISLPLG